MGLTYIYTRLNLSLGRLLLVKLLETHAKGLETLGEQMSELIHAYALEDAYRDLILRDYGELIQEELYEDHDARRLYAEVDELTQALWAAVLTRRALGTPRAVHFEFPATVVLEYPPGTALSLSNRPSALSPPVQVNPRLRRLPSTLPVKKFP